METTTLSSKGQIIIPKTIRESHHWEPGEKIIIEDLLPASSSNWRAFSRQRHLSRDWGVPATKDLESRWKR